MTIPLKAEHRGEWEQEVPSGEPELKPAKDKEPPEKGGAQPDPPIEPVDKEPNIPSARTQTDGARDPQVHPGDDKEDGEGGAQPDPPVDPVDKDPDA